MPRTRTVARRSGCRRTPVSQRCACRSRWAATRRARICSRCSTTPSTSCLLRQEAPNEWRRAAPKPLAPPRGEGAQRQGGTEMNLHALDWSLLGPPLLAGLLVLATHVPLGAQVLDRGIVFIDLAVAQMAGLG